MPNTKDLPRQQYKKILAVGPTGSGKTTLFGTLPGKKFMYIFDPNSLESLRRFDIDYEVFLPKFLNLAAIPLARAKAEKTQVVKYEEPTVYNDWLSDFEGKYDSGFFDHYDAIGIDSFTSLRDHVLDRHMFLNGRFGKWPEQADHTGAINNLGNIFRVWSRIPNCIAYVTAHTTMDLDEGLGRTINQLNMSKSLQSRIPMLFTDIWRCEADIDQEKRPVFTVHTTSDFRNPYLRCSTPDVPSSVDVTIGNWDYPTNFGLGSILKRYQPGPVKAEQQS